MAMALTALLGFLTAVILSTAGVTIFNWEFYAVFALTQADKWVTALDARCGGIGAMNR